MAHPSTVVRRQVFVGLGLVALLFTSTSEAVLPRVAEGAGATRFSPSPSMGHQSGAGGQAAGEAEAARLVAMLPSELDGQPLKKDSWVGAALGSFGGPGFVSYLEGLGADIDEVVVAAATNGDPTRRVFIYLYAIPSVRAEELVAGMIGARGLQPERRTIGGRDVVILRPAADDPSYLYAADGLLVEVSSSDAPLVAAALRALPAGETPSSPSSPSPAPSADVSGTFRLVERRDLETGGAAMVSLSPDGGHLAGFTREAGRLRLCIFDAATSERRSCAPELANDPWSLAWAPDGGSLAYTESWGQRLKDGDLWLMDVATGDAVNLDDDAYEGDVFGRDVGTASFTLPMDLAFAPDSASVTYARLVVTGGEPSGAEIVTVSVGNLSRTVVLRFPGCATAQSEGMQWAADGSRLFYAVSTAGRCDGLDGVWVLERGGEQARRLPEVGGGPGAARLLQVSADGGRLLLAYPGAQGGTTPSLALVDGTSGAGASAGTIAEPGTGTLDAVAAAISADGAALLALAGPPFDAAAEIHEIDGDRMVTLVEGGLRVAVESGFPPVWARNGSILLPSVLPMTAILEVAGAFPHLGR